MEGPLEGPPDGIESYARIWQWYRQNLGRLDSDTEYGAHSRSLIERLPAPEEARRAEMRAVFLEVVSGLLKWGHEESEGGLRMADYAKRGLEESGGERLTEEDIASLFRSPLLNFLSDDVRTHVGPLSDQSVDGNEGAVLTEDAAIKESKQAGAESRNGDQAPESPVLDTAFEGVEWSADQPTPDDQLQRKPLAEALVSRLRSVHADEENASFLLHVDGPWGSGKSTLLLLMQEALEPDWLVVSYNAWRQASIGPTWWSLLTSLRKTYQRRLPVAARVRLRAAEGLARLSHGGPAYVATLAFATVLALVVGWLLLRVTGGSIRDAADTFGAAVGAAGILYAGVAIAGRFLFWDSPRGARAFEEITDNPMGQVAEHFAWLIGRIEKPVAFFIDDLDRCKENDVVEVLESVQTLMRTAGADVPPSDKGGGPYFVVAADGAWIRRSFEHAYEAFAGTVDEPGRPLGYLFLDKLFQLSVPVPELSLERKRRFLARLLRLQMADGDRDMEAKAKDAREQIARSGSDADVVAVFRAASEELRDLIAPDVVQRLASADVERATEHALSKFAPLLPPNPRSMKRFINAFGVARTVHTLEGSPVESDVLALWTVLRARWPLLAQEFTALPELIERVGAAVPAGGDVPEEILPLLQSQEVIDVVQFPFGGPLTHAEVKSCTRRGI